MKVHVDRSADTSSREPVAAGTNLATARPRALPIDVMQSPRMLAQRRAIASAACAASAPTQRTEMDAITLANQLSTVGRLDSWQTVHRYKDSFDAEAWRSIVSAYNRGNHGGTRLRYTPPRPKPEPVPEARTPKTTATDRFKTVGAVAGGLGSLVSGAQTIHQTGLGDALQHLPALGALSSASTALTKSERADEAYRRGDLATSAMHRTGSIASGVKSVSDGVTVATMGLSAPVTVPVSMLGSAINALTSVPDYLSSASTVLSDPRRAIARTMLSATSVPERVGSALGSVGSTLSEYARSGSDTLGFTTAEEDKPPLSPEEQRAKEEAAARRQQGSQVSKAQWRGLAKDVEGTKK